MIVKINDKSLQERLSNLLDHGWAIAKNFSRARETEFFQFPSDG